MARIEAPEIDRINIHQASLKAMQMAVQSLRIPPDYVLVDGKFPLPSLPGRQEAIVDGDARCHAIAAASILAKVSRDRWMEEVSQKHPGFSFQRHKGYGTAAHYEELRRYGPTPLHRKSFLRESLLTGGHRGAGRP